MAVVNKFNVNNKQVTLDADIIENMSANDVSYNDSFQYDENTVGEKISELTTEVSELEETLYNLEQTSKFDDVYSFTNSSEFPISNVILENAYISANGTIVQWPTSAYNIYGLQLSEDSFINIKRSWSHPSGTGVIAVVDDLTNVVVGKKLKLVEDGTTVDLDKNIYVKKGQYLIVSEGSATKTKFYNLIAILSKSKIDELDRRNTILKKEVHDNNIYSEEDGEPFTITDIILSNAFIGGNTISQFSTNAYNIYGIKMDTETLVRLKRVTGSPAGSNVVAIVDDVSDVAIGKLYQT